MRILALSQRHPRKSVRIRMAVKPLGHPLAHSEFYKRRLTPMFPKSKPVLAKAQHVKSKQLRRVR